MKPLFNQESLTEIKNLFTSVRKLLTNNSKTDNSKICHKIRMKQKCDVKSMNNNSTTVM